MRKGSRFFTVGALLLCSWFFCASAYGSAKATPVTFGKLVGFIFKANKKTPLKNAQVVITHMVTGKKYISNITDVTGDYMIGNLPEGNYKIEIFVKDKLYRLKRIDFSVKILPNKITNLSFALKRSLAPFILKPYGMALLIGGSALTYSIGHDLLIEEEEPVSPVIK